MNGKEHRREWTNGRRRLAIAGAGILGIVGLAAGPAMASTTPAPPPLPGSTSPVPAPTSSPQAPAPTTSPTGSSTAPSSSSLSTGSTSTNTQTASPTSSNTASTSGKDFDPSSGSYTPPLHGTNPHGEGTALGVSSEPRNTPDSSDCSSPSSDEIVVVGNSCGEQNANGSYHGHVTVLALGGNEFIGMDSDSSGSKATGSLAPLTGPLLSQLNSGLAQLCSGSSGNVCLSVLNASSATTSTGSTNSFQGVNAALGGSSGLSVGVLDSNGNINSTSSCQSANGSSSVATVAAGGNTIVDTASSSDNSNACSDGTKTNTSKSDVLAGAISPLTSQIVPGCPDGTPNTVVKLFGQIAIPPSPQLAQVIAAYCNATDSSQAQAAAPYGVNEGLTVVALGALGVHAPASESLATWPPLGATSPSLGPPQPQLGPSGGSGPGGGAAQPPAATPSNGNLAFTGMNLALELLLAIALMGAGGAAWAASRPRRRIA